MDNIIAPIDCRILIKPPKNNSMLTMSNKKYLQIFTKYEQHRRLLLEDILASIARIPSSKHNLRSFQLNSDQHIQMLTALVLQLVQCVVTLPETLCKTQDKAKDKDQGDSDSKKVSCINSLCTYLQEYCKQKLNSQHTYML